MSRTSSGPPSSPILGGCIAGGLTLYGILAKRAARRRTAATLSGQKPDLHGRRAAWPSEIPRLGWWDIAMRVMNDISRTNASLLAAGVAFYAFLAIPSAFTALVSLYGLVFDPSDVARQVEGMRGVLPKEAIGLFSAQLQSLTSRSSSSLGIGLVISLLIALWSARSGTASMVSALNTAYEEEEKRSIIRFQLIALGLTVGAVAFALVALALIAVLPAIIGLLPLGDFGKTLAAVLRWPILIALVMIGLAVTYRFAPSRREPKWRWVSWGAVIATVLWIIASGLFSVYVGQFASYDKTYGSLGAVVVLLIWLYLSAFVVLVGAELNAEIEHQTARDSTEGRPKPMGQRGARMADTLGRARGA
ncbi:MAG TPA: YihY/virulence factor BrkB family protein [Stellaceae bacterium]|nr:YihY/virulence factor BrkB family protein [Stellaceae bacterium]